MIRHRFLREEQRSASRACFFAVLEGFLFPFGFSEAALGDVSYFTRVQNLAHMWDMMKRGLPRARGPGRMAR